MSLPPHQRQWRTYRSRIDKKSVDFVLFDIETFTPHLVIELDDSSHDREERHERDLFVDAVLKKAGIRIEYVKNAYSYDAKVLFTIVNL
ncbi:MAG TPA: DUF2726 domain-containing protein [Candidatus Paceibacterota bacterium]|nr:DUF2726 domain-containing protein [Candidatus Paceibacterota bacterium]